jgi:hypothetical protein
MDGAATADCTGTLVISTCDNAPFNTDLVTYEEHCDDMTQIACNGHTACSGYTSYLEASVTPGNNYLIRVGFDGIQYPHDDNGTLSISCE